MRLGFTGTQKGMTDLQKERVISFLLMHEVVEVHHGDCVGADSEFHDLIRERCPKVQVHIHPPELDVKRAFKEGDVVHPEKAYLKRNRDIVNVVDVLLACPKGPEIMRSGTWATVRYARKRGKQVGVFYPQGSVVEF